MRTKTGRMKALRRLERRAAAKAEADLGEEAFLDNDFVPGELDAPAERIVHERAPHDEADFDAEAEDAVERADLRQKLQADRIEDASGPDPAPSEESVLEAEADEAVQAAKDVASLDGKEEGR